MKMTKGRLVIIGAAIDETDEELHDYMRHMKRQREDRACEHIVLTIGHYDKDPRELWQIPEVQEFCRRLVDTGFFAYLDTFTTVPALVKKDFEVVNGAFGAFEVWLCSERKPFDMEMSLAMIHDEFFPALQRGNEAGDKLLGALESAR
jgi:hypothetical protein